MKNAAPVNSRKPKGRRRRTLGAGRVGMVVFHDLERLRAVRADLERRGITLADLARELDIPRSTLYAVLNGQKRCLRGDAHRAAVLVGLKDGVIE